VDNDGFEAQRFGIAWLRLKGLGAWLTVGNCSTLKRWGNAVYKVSLAVSIYVLHFQAKDNESLNAPLGALEIESWGNKPILD
jgi:hypothetical protein